MPLDHHLVRLKEECPYQSQWESTTFCIVSLESLALFCSLRIETVQLFKMAMNDLGDVSWVELVLVQFENGH